MIKNILSIAILLCVTACSNKAIYNDIQREQRRQCRGLPDSERDPCLESVDLSYEEYELEREQLKKK